MVKQCNIGEGARQLDKKEIRIRMKIKKKSAVKIISAIILYVIIMIIFNIFL